MRIKRARSTKTDTVDDVSFKSSTNYNNTHFQIGDQAIQEADQEEEFPSGELSLRGSVQSNSFRNSFVVGLNKGLRKSVNQQLLKPSDTSETNLMQEFNKIDEGNLMREQIQEFQSNFFKDQDLEQVEEADQLRETDPKNSIVPGPLQLTELQKDDTMPNLIKKLERLKQMQQKLDPKHKHMFTLCPSVKELKTDISFFRTMMEESSRDVLAEKRKRVSEIYLG